MRLRQALIGVVALALAAGAVAVTGVFLTGGLQGATVPVFADFVNCGQGIREGGDVKLRGVLIGRIETIARTGEGTCRLKLGLFPEDVDQVPANAGAQIRAKTVFGEKWVELLYPSEPQDARIASNDVIGVDRTVDPLEVETILNTALPLLDAIDPNHLAGALEALATGFAGHEEAAIRGMESGIEALRPVNDNRALVEEGIRQLAGTGETFERIDEDLLAAMDNLDRLNKFTANNAALIAESLDKAPRLLNELSFLFEARYDDFVELVNSGATVLNVLAARSGDVDRLLAELPKFNSNWIRNLGHQCRYRQATDEPGKARGEVVPGRCWRVHNLVSHSQGPYAPGTGPGPDSRASAPSDADFRAAGLSDVSPLGRMLYAPAVGGGR